MDALRDRRCRGGTSQCKPDLRRIRVRIFREDRNRPAIPAANGKKLDVRSMKIVIEFVKTRMRNDHHAAFSEQRLIAIHVEVVPERHHLNQQRIQRRIDVIRRNIRNPRDENVALALYRDLVLPIVHLQDLVVDRLSLARVTGDQLILRRYRVEHFSPGAAWQFRKRPLHRFPFHPIAK